MKIIYFIRIPVSWKIIMAIVVFFAWGAVNSTLAQCFPKILNKPLVEVQLPELPKDDRSGGLIAYDLDGDGAMDFLITRPGMIIAVKSDDNILWTHSVDIQLTYRSEENGLPGHHAPGVQAGDITGDGFVEVLYLTRSGELHVVNGANGAEIRRIAIESPKGTEKWEHLVIGNFRGYGDRDLLLQATNIEGYRLGRFIAAYAICDLMERPDPVPLWTRDDFHAAAHNGARIADLNGDGRDEIIGGSIVSPEGEEFFRLSLRGDSHIDAVQIGDVQPKRPGLEVVALQEGGRFLLFPFDNKIAHRINWNFNKIWGAGEKTFLMNPYGLIWARHHHQIEPQNAAIGKFKRDSDEVQIWLRSRFDIDQKPYVFDSAGRLVSSYALRDVAPEDWTRKGLEVIVPIHWTGTGQQHLAAKARHESGDVAIIDALTGKFLVRIPESADRLYVADVLDDWREELVVLSGNQLRIYGNTEDNPNPDRASLWLQQHYQRSKQTWNYYSP